MEVNLIFIIKSRFIVHILKVCKSLVHDYNRVNRDLTPLGQMVLANGAKNKG